MIKIKRECKECGVKIPKSEDCLVLMATPDNFKRVGIMEIAHDKIKESVIGYICRSCELITIES